MKTIGERLGYLISSLGYNVNSFSKGLGYSNNSVTIGRIITESRMPSSETMLKISEHFPKVNMDWLLTGRGSMELQPNIYGQSDAITPILPNMVIEGDATVCDAAPTVGNNGMIPLSKTEKNEDMCSLHPVPINNFDKKSAFAPDENNDGDNARKSATVVGFTQVQNKSIRDVNGKNIVIDTGDNNVNRAGDDFFSDDNAWLLKAQNQALQKEIEYLKSRLETKKKLSR
jgi:hypothetical protein